MSGRIHFDGEPSTFRQMRALFNETSTLQQKPELATRIDRKFRLTRLSRSVADWYRKYGNRRSA